MKKNVPVITHTEILCYAMRYIQMQINDKRGYLEGIPGCEAILEKFQAEYTPKMDALKELYRIETGTEYK